MKLGLRYQTTYDYDEAVGLSPHDIRLFPKGDRFRRVRRLSFVTKPRAIVRYWRDVFDNTVATCSFPKRSKTLEFQLSIDLDLEEKNPFDFILEKEAVETPFEYDPAIAGLLAPYRERRTRRRLDLPGWLPPSRKRPRGTVSTLVALNKTLHKRIAYERRDEGAALSPAETLRLRRGACRDVAVLLAAVLRQLGFATRLASGYLRESNAGKKYAEGSLHAWTEVFLPGAGWVGVDGTNGVFCNHNFIGAAVGLTPGDITPIHGVFFHNKRVPSRMTSRLRLIDL